MSESLTTQEIDRFRVALKFSLWSWALYWLGGGALLMILGLDIIGILVFVGSVVTFALLMMTGALRTSSSRNVKQFLLERPLYLVAMLFLAAVMTPIIAAVVDVTIVLGATIYLGAMVYTLTRLVAVYKSQDKPLLQSGLDQAFIAVGLGLLSAFVMFADAWVTLGGGGAVSGPPLTVALVNWVSLLYPALLLVGTAGLREPLRKPSLRGLAPTDAPAPDGVQA